MKALIRENSVDGEAFLQAYLRGSALLQDLDELGLHQAAAHLSLALDVMDRNPAFSVRGRAAGAGPAPACSAVGQG